VQSLSALQLTVAAWQRISCEGSQMQLGSSGVGSGCGALPEQAHCSPDDAHWKPGPQSVAVEHGST